MDSREHYQADDLMKSIKARSGNHAAGVLALPYIVSASTPKSNTPRGGGKFELAAGARKRKVVFLRNLSST